MVLLSVFTPRISCLRRVELPISDAMNPGTCPRVRHEQRDELRRHAVVQRLAATKFPDSPCGRPRVSGPPARARRRRTPDRLDRGARLVRSREHDPEPCAPSPRRRRDCRDCTTHAVRERQRREATRCARGITANVAASACTVVSTFVRRSWPCHPGRSGAARPPPGTRVCGSPRANASTACVSARDPPPATSTTEPGDTCSSACALT